MPRPAGVRAQPLEGANADVTRQACRDRSQAESAAQVRRASFIAIQSDSSKKSEASEKLYPGSVEGRKEAPSVVTPRRPCPRRIITMIKMAGGRVRT